MTPNDLTEDEVELLLYLEKQSVEHGCTFGLFDSSLRGERFNHLHAWSLSGFIRYGRITWATTPDLLSSYWIELSDEAWTAAHAIRRARASEAMASRTWVKVDEMDHPERNHEDKAAALRRFKTPKPTSKQGASD